MNDQTLRHISCSDPACPTYKEIFTYTLKQLCSDSKKQQERESSMHIKSYMSLPLMELMDDCCFDGWSCLFWVSISWLRPSLSLFLSQSMCLDWNLTGSLFKGVCIFSFWSSNYLLLKHISQTFSGMCYVLHQSCLHSFTNTEKGKLLHVNKWIPLVFRAAIVLYLDC